MISLNTNILNNDIQNFIQQNLNEDSTRLILKGSSFQNVTIQEIVEQIIAKKKCKKKLPTWFNTPQIYYPNKLNIEQTSSEITANYKTNLITGNTLIDITGGFGVDCFAFAENFKEVKHCEINKELSSIVKYNYKCLQVDNINTIADDGIAYLEKSNQKFDYIYVDPSRRNDSKGKVFLLKDCLPNIPKNLNTLFKYTDQILLKLSPILDITASINELKFIKEIHIVATNNEVKELLFILEKSFIGAIKINTINIKKDTTDFLNSFTSSNIEATYSLPKTYLYEPNSAILKAGLFNEVSHQLILNKLNTNSHLYTNNDLIIFPGRRFKILEITTYNKKKIKKLIPSNKANITTRNFPETVAQIRKKTGLKDGGNQYLFFTTDLNNKLIVIVCEKI